MIIRQIPLSASTGQGQSMPGHEMIQQSEYLSLLRWALHTGSPQHSVNDALSATVRDESDEGVIFKKLIAGILFSRKFILSYQLVLLCLLSFFALSHGISRLRSWRRVRQTRASRQAGEIKSGRSSSSSTLNANDGTSEAFSKLDEQSPLLLAGSHRKTSYSNPGYTLRAFLVYQPSPIPVINKSLPSNGCTLIILMFLSLQIFYTFYNVPLSVPMLFVFADRTSLVFVANLPLLYLFAAKNQPLKYLTGHSYETLNILHRRLGEAMCLLALLHGLGMLGVWYTILRPGGSTFASFVLSKIILLGKSILHIFLPTPRLVQLESQAKVELRWMLKQHDLFHIGKADPRSFDRFIGFGSLRDRILHFYG